MYAKGMSLKDISEMIQHIYKVELSIETISKLTSSVSEEVQKWQERPLEKFYPFIYVDCLYAPVKRDLISEKSSDICNAWNKQRRKKRRIRNMDK